MEIIVGKNAGFCYGVKRAVNNTKKLVTEYKTSNKIYCLGEIVHNEEVINDLQKKGITFIDDLNDVENNDKVIIRAHGVTKDTYKIAKDKEIELIDYTCPNVLKIHNIVEKYSIDDYYIILCGNKSHPENIGTISYCKKYSIIEETNELEKVICEYENSSLKKILLISQTTYSLEKFKIIEEKLKSRYSDNLVIKNTICKTTELRQKETEELSRKVDCMLIIGGKNSSNTKKLYDISIKNCPHTYLINSYKELEITNFSKKLNNNSKIGIMAGASTPLESIKKVIEKMDI